jgi:hypothetical protein
MLGSFFPGLWSVIHPKSTQCQGADTFILAAIPELEQDGGMEHNKPFESFAKDAHEKAQAAIDHAKEVRTGAAEELRKKHAEKTAREPHLFADGDLKCCSACGHPFDPDVKPSMSVAFADHVLKAHKPGQMTEA